MKRIIMHYISIYIKKRVIYTTGVTMLVVNFKQMPSKSTSTKEAIAMNCTLF